MRKLDPHVVIAQNFGDLYYYNLPSDDGDGKDLRNVGVTPYMYTVASTRNMIHISRKIDLSFHFEEGNSMDLRNVGITAYIYTMPSLRNRIHIVLSIFAVDGIHIDSSTQRLH
jgi:hypothetical protein